MGSVTKRIENNIRARQMAQAAHLIPHTRIPGVTPMRLQEYRSVMLRIFRRYKTARKRGQIANAIKQDRQRRKAVRLGLLGQAKRFVGGVLKALRKIIPTGRRDR